MVNIIFPSQLAKDLGLSWIDDDQCTTFGPNMPPKILGMLPVAFTATAFLGLYNSSAGAASTLDEIPPQKNKLSSGTKTYCKILYTDWLMMIDDEDQTMIIAKQLLKGSVIPTIMTSHHFSTTSPYFCWSKPTNTWMFPKNQTVIYCDNFPFSILSHLSLACANMQKRSNTVIMINELFVKQILLWCQKYPEFDVTGNRSPVTPQRLWEIMWTVYLGRWTHNLRIF